MIKYELLIELLPDSICTSQQHLEGNIWNAISHLFQSLPWTFVQESQTNVKCCATPKIINYSLRFQFIN